MAVTDEVTLTDIDFELIAACTKPHVLRKCIVLLEQDGGYYYQLLDAAKKKLASVLKEKTGVGRSGIALGAPSDSEIRAAKADLLAWQRSLSHSYESTTAGDKGLGQANCPGLSGLRNVDKGTKRNCKNSQSHTVEEDAEDDSDGVMKNSHGEGSSSGTSSSANKKTHQAPSHGRGVGIAASESGGAAGMAIERESGEADPSETVACPTTGEDRRRRQVRIQVSIDHGENESDEESPTGNRTKPNPTPREDPVEVKSSPTPPNINECPGAADSSLGTCATTTGTSPSPLSSADNSNNGRGQSTSGNDDLVVPLCGTCGPFVRQRATSSKSGASPKATASPLPQATPSCYLPTLEEENSYSPRTRKILATKKEALTAFSEGNFEKSLGLLTACLEGAEENPSDVALPDAELPPRLSKNLPLHRCRSMCKRISSELHSVLYSNRSLVYMKLGKYARAAEDSLRAMQLDSRNVKALWRRAQALYALGGEENLRQAATVAKRVEAFLRGTPEVSTESSGCSPAKQLSDFQLAVDSAIRSL